jgi:hypothetical protein
MEKVLVHWSNIFDGKLLFFWSHILTFRPIKVLASFFEVSQPMKRQGVDLIKLFFLPASTLRHNKLARSYLTINFSPTLHLKVGRVGVGALKRLA